MANTRGNKKRPLIEMAGSDVTFFRDFENNNFINDNCDGVSRGNGTATFTSVRDATHPATYVDTNGVIQLVTDANTPRFQKGYYDSTGFHTKSGIMMERASTNLVPKSSIINDATWTATNATASDAEAITSPDGTATTSSLTASAGNGNILLATAVTAQTYSVWLKRKTGTGVINITANGGTTWTAVTVTSSWCRFTETRASASQKCGIQIVTNTDAVYVWGNQFEALPYATSFIPTTSAALTRNTEALSYVNAGNRTAATESIFIKFSPCSNFANDGKERYLYDSDTKRRYSEKNTTATTVSLNYPNSTDSSGCTAACTTTPLANVSYVYAATMASTGDPNITVYTNGTSEASSNTDFTAPAWGTNWYFGHVSGANQLDGIFQAVAIFSGVKNQADITAITEILNF